MAEIGISRFATLQLAKENKNLAKIREQKKKLEGQKDRLLIELQPNRDQLNKLGREHGTLVRQETETLDRINLLGRKKIELEQQEEKGRKGFGPGVRKLKRFLNERKQQEVRILESKATLTKVINQYHNLETKIQNLLFELKTSALLFDFNLNPDLHNAALTDGDWRKEYQDLLSLFLRHSSPDSKIIEDFRAVEQQVSNYAKRQRIEAEKCKKNV